MTVSSIEDIKGILLGSDVDVDDMLNIVEYVARLEEKVAERVQKATEIAIAKGGNKAFWPPKETMREMELWADRIRPSLKPTC